MRVRIGVGCGPINHFEIGGLDNEWHGVLAGPALADTIKIVETVRPDEIGLSDEVWASVGGPFGRSVGRHGVTLVTAANGLVNPVPHFERDLP